MLIIVFFNKTRLQSSVNAWNVSFGEISNLKFKILELQMNRRIRGIRGKKRQNEVLKMPSVGLRVHSSQGALLPRVPRILRLTQLRFSG